jgi:hypothetical protein
MTGSLIALLLLGLVIAGCWVGWLVWAKRKRDKAEALAEPTLDIIFNGRPFAYYQAPDASGGLSLETLVRGAEERGYRLVYETRPRPFRMVRFERISQDAGER